MSFCYFSLLGTISVCPQSSLWFIENKELQDLYESACQENQEYRTSQWRVSGNKSFFYKHHMLYSWMKWRHHQSLQLTTNLNTLAMHQSIYCLNPHLWNSLHTQASITQIPPWIFFIGPMFKSQTWSLNCSYAVIDFRLTFLSHIWGNQLKSSKLSDYWSQLYPI